MRITSPYIDEHEDYQVVSPHAVRVFPLWILLYLKHQETTRDNRKEQIMSYLPAVPGTIKFFSNTFEHAFYVCLNQGEAYAPEEIRTKSVCMNEDIGEALKEL